MNPATIETLLNLPSVKTELAALAAGEFKERRTQIESAQNDELDFKLWASESAATASKLNGNVTRAEAALKVAQDAFTDHHQKTQNHAHRTRARLTTVWQGIESTADPRLNRFAVWASAAKNAIQFHSHTRENFLARSWGFEQRYLEVRTAVALCDSALSWAIAARRESLSRDDVSFKIAEFIEGIKTAAPDASIPNFEG